MAPGIIRGRRRGQRRSEEKIFILDLPKCIRIRTGERGSEAIG